MCTHSSRFRSNDRAHLEHLKTIDPIISDENVNKSSTISSLGLNGCKRERKCARYKRHIAVKCFGCRLHIIFYSFFFLYIFFFFIFVGASWRREREKNVNLTPVFSGSIQCASDAGWCDAYTFIGLCIWYWGQFRPKWNVRPTALVIILLLQHIRIVHVRH